MICYKNINVNILCKGNDDYDNDGDVYDDDNSSFFLST